MAAAAERAIDYVGDMERLDFEADQRTQDAVVANIAAIGECVAKIMDGFPDFVAEHSEIPWRDIRTMRNRIAHQYFEIDQNTVWITVSQSLPELVSRLDALRHWRAQGE
ncbi:HepT-like ribonuclease domain-containing protein [Neorhizobium lilium]|nr:DUF86 domain-containing protein [Neorhizobium lilium]